MLLSFLNPPTLQASFSQAGMQLNWELNQLASSYNILRSETNDFATAKILKESLASTSFVDTTAGVDVPYYYFVQACNDNGCSQASSPIYAAQLSQPINLLATALEEGISLEWDTKPLATFYKISRNLTNDFATAGILNDSVASTKFVDSTASLDTAYFYFVQACNSHGCSESSLGVEARLLSEPLNLQASLSEQSMRIDWDKQDFATSYSVYRSISQDFAVAELLIEKATPTSYTDTSFALDTPYYYFAKACNQNGCSQTSAPVYAVMLSPPIHLQESFSDEGMQIDWETNLHAGLYEVYRNTTDDFSSAGPLSKNATSNSFVDTTASLDTPYYYFIRACNDNGCSQESNGVRATQLSQTLNLQVTTSINSMAINWDENSLAENYQVFRSQEPEFTRAASLLETTPAKSFIDTGIEQNKSYYYFVKSCNQNGCSQASTGSSAAFLSQPLHLEASFSQAGMQLDWDANELASHYQVFRSHTESATALSLEATPHSFLDTSASLDTAYSYSVKACNQNGCSQASAELTAAQLSQPISLQASFSQDGIQLDWQANNLATFYKVLRGETNDFATAEILDEAVASSSFVDTTAIEDTTYYYFVKACNANGCSAESEAIDATRLSQPISLQASLVESGMQISWQANSFASFYKVFRNETSDFATAEILTQNASANSFVDTTASLDTTYYYFIQACNSNGCSQASSPVYAAQLSQPISLQANLTDEAMQIDWQANLLATHYQIYRGHDRRFQPCPSLERKC